ncbi:MAG TPA: FGGY-family carbohydrate kinase, partial [Acidimicrobiales bacterium]
GGALNEVLCQLTADACAVPVYAGPVEAAAIGNALMQFRGLEVLENDLDAMRRLVATSFPTAWFTPRGDVAGEWDAAEAVVDARPL